MDYLVNVGMASKSYIILSLIFLVASWALPRVYQNGLAGVVTGKVEVSESTARITVATRRLFRLASGVVLVIGLVVGIISPSNTIKLEADYNKQQDLNRQARLNESAVSNAPAIQDISRQPTSPEDRAQGALDMRSRVSQP